MEGKFEGKKEKMCKGNHLITGKQCTDVMCDYFGYIPLEEEEEEEKPIIDEESKKREREYWEWVMKQQEEVMKEQPQESPLKPKEELKTKKELLPLAPELQKIVDMINFELCDIINRAAGGEEAKRVSGKYERFWLSRHFPEFFKKTMEENNIMISGEQWKILQKIKVPESAQDLFEKFKENWYQTRKFIL